MESDAQKDWVTCLVTELLSGRVGIQAWVFLVLKITSFDYTILLEYSFSKIEVEKTEDKRMTK